MERILKNKMLLKIICIILIILIVLLIYTYENKKEIENGDDSGMVSEEINKGEIDEEYKADKEKQNKIIIHITGEVKNKGIIELEEESRIIDAINKAGGVTENADLDSVNLANKIEDGMKIRIPSKNETMLNEELKNVNAESKLRNEGLTKKVNINKATQKELENLPGIGKEMASRIVEYRTKNGKFSVVSDLKKVKGIGDSKFANIENYVTVD